MKLQSLIIMLFILLAVTACNKDNTTPVKLEGTYTGKFTSTSVNANTGAVKVKISGKTFQATLNTFMSLESRGSYAISNNQITFQDSLAHTANFDWGLLLNGTYTQSTKGDSIVWTRTSGSNKYTYTLKKE